MLRDMLDRKLAERGKPGLVKVGRWYPSSQLCSDCGYRYEGAKDLGVREVVCPECGAWHDRETTPVVQVAGARHKKIPRSWYNRGKHI